MFGSLIEIWHVVHAESSRVEGSQAAQQQSEEVKVLAALAHQLVQDVGDDQDSYQQAFGTRSICLPAVTCRYADLPWLCCLSHDLGLYNHGQNGRRSNLARRLDTCTAAD